MNKVDSLSALSRKLIARLIIGGGMVIPSYAQEVQEIEQSKSKITVSCSIQGSKSYTLTTAPENDVFYLDIKGCRVDEEALGIWATTILAHLRVNLSAKADRCHTASSALLLDISAELNEKEFIGERLKLNDLRMWNVHKNSIELAFVNLKWPVSANGVVRQINNIGEQLYPVGDEPKFRNLYRGEFNVHTLLKDDVEDAAADETGNREVKMEISVHPPRTLCTINGANNAQTRKQIPWRITKK